MKINQKVTIEDLKRCNSLSECSKLLFGVNYYNGSVKKQLVSHCNQLGLDIETHINNKGKRYCINCGKQLLKHQMKFCSSSCAATYNNKQRKHSEETKKKISESLIKSMGNGNPRKKRGQKLSATYRHICVICGKEFFSTRKHTTHCSRQCVGQDSIINANLKEKALQRVQDGVHNGWNSRNITSYPEQFWINVLEDNGISFIREDHTNGKYFLDFLIEKNNIRIDLEIDGKQHKYRVQHDLMRDEFLTSNGYVVYRVEWNEINSETGKKLMKSKIDDFINFYNNL